MPPLRLLPLLLLLAAATAAAQPSDVALALRAPERVAAGTEIPLAVTVTNLGPNNTIAFIHVPNLAPRYPAGGVGDRRCGFTQPQVMCNVPIAAGEAITFDVVLAAPNLAGRTDVSAASFLYPLDYDESNNAAKTSLEIVDAPDVAVSIQLFPSLAPLGASRVRLSIGNLAARPAPLEGFITIPAPLQVTSVGPNCTHLSGETYRCNGSGEFQVYVPGRGGPVTLTAWTDVEDFNPANNRAELVAPIYDLAKLKLALDAAEHLDENAAGPVRVRVTNQSDFDAANVVLVIGHRLDSRVVAASAPGCTADARKTLTCSLGTLAAGAQAEVVATVVYRQRYAMEEVFAAVTQPLAPDVSGGGASLNTTVTHYREFVVGSAADAGAGSLRETIGAVNQFCAGDDPPPCKILFDFDGEQTIALRSALPLVRARIVAIDGGGRVFLDGCGVAAGDGLAVDAGIVVVRRLAIGGFPGSGILISSNVDRFYNPLSTIENNFIGVDLHGNAVPNGNRGVMSTHFIGARVRGNVIANNGRSGLFLPGWNSDIRDNTIVSNGASGIFLGFGTDSVVENNVIADNGEFGVCIAPQGRVEVRANRISGNGGGAFDIGLDGPTPGDAPRIDAARFEGGETVIEGHLPPRTPVLYPQTKTVYLYANRDVDAEGFAEGEEFLGTATPDAGGTFSLRVARDLRGRWIDATLLVVTDYGDAVYRQSSEFGPPLQAN